MTTKKVTRQRATGVQGATGSPRKPQPKGAERRVLTIDRSKWRRGGPQFNGEKGYTKLLNERGLMCCLGFDALACGLPTDMILGRHYPSSLDSSAIPANYRATRLAKGKYGGSTESKAAYLAVEANDNELISDRERERRVRKNLIALGWHDVKFIDGEAQS